MPTIVWRLMEVKNMVLTQKNKIIEMMFNERIENQGLGSVLIMDPIENGFMQRPCYYRDKQGRAVFSVFMWQLNKLSDIELESEIDNRIKAAKQHFGI